MPVTFKQSEPEVNWPITETATWILIFWLAHEFSDMEYK